MDIRQKRQELGLTLKDVADACRDIDSRIDVPMISRFETGVCLPTEEVKKRIYCTLQITETEECIENECLSVLREKPLKSPPAWIAVFAAHIPFGKSRAVSRKMLCEKTGQSDRQMRRMIEQARRWGYVIVNDGDGAGYYQSDSIADIMAQYQRETSRAMSILTTRKLLRQRLKEAGWNVK